MNVTDVTSTPPFTWTPTAITTMDVAGFYGDDYFQITQSGISITLPDPQVPAATGAWVAAGVAGVPDAASTAMLVGLAMVGLWGFGNFVLRRQMAMARVRCGKPRRGPSN
jgi:hypothetical protein